MKKGRYNKEPAPRLLDAVTILLGCCGYIQIGFLPSLNAAQEVILDVRAIIVIGETYIPFDIEEIANFFLSIRQHDDFVDLDGREEYLPFVQNEFMGNFFIHTNGPSYTISYVNYDNGTNYEAIFPNKGMIEHILSFERIVSGHMNILSSLEDGQLTLLTKLEELRIKCANTPTHVQYLAENTCDKFTTEIACNLFSFFAQYWNSKNQ